MAGNPLATLFPYVKKYAVEIYLTLGVVTFLKHRYDISTIYKSVYAKNDFQRKFHLEKLRAFVSKN